MKKIDLTKYETKDLLELKLRVCKELKSRKPKKKSSKSGIKHRNYKVYVLVCKNGKFYVGMTAQKIENRYEQHAQGKGARWTKLHPPIGIEEVITLGYTDELTALKRENEVTREVISKYGGDNVRGGDLCYVDQRLMDKRLLKITKKLATIQERKIDYQEQLASDLSWI